MKKISQYLEEFDNISEEHIYEVYSHSLRLKLKQFLKDSLTEMLEGVESKVQYKSGILYEMETLRDRGIINQERERIKLLLNDLRGK